MHFIVNTDTALDIGGRTGGGFNRGPRPAANKTTEGGAQ